MDWRYWKVRLGKDGQKVLWETAKISWYSHPGLWEWQKMCIVGRKHGHVPGWRDIRTFVDRSEIEGNYEGILQPLSGKKHVGFSAMERIV